MKKATLFQIIALLTVLALPLDAAATRAEFDAQVGEAMAKLGREAAHADGVVRLAGLVQREFGTPIEELQWAVENELPWGDIVAFAYIRATNGRSFSEIVKTAASRDLWSYTEESGLSPDKMARSLDEFSKHVERERNSRIFEEMRTNRRVSPMPDLGSGFGLFQEALDFRRIDSPRPTKIHTVGAAGLAKGDQ